MSPSGRSFNVILSDAEYQKLSELAKAHHSARSFIIRESLRWRYEMEKQSHPICSSGQRCFAPHLHQPPPPPPPEPTKENP